MIWLMVPFEVVPLSWIEVACAVLVLAPLLFFVFCIYYLWRILLYAAPGRSRLAVLSPPGAAGNRDSDDAATNGHGAAGGRVPTVAAASPPVAPRQAAVADVARRGGPTGVAAPPQSVPNRRSDVRFVLLIPAHDEELVIGAAQDSLQRLDYPRECYRVVVVADNCTDRTAEIARAHGAGAYERHDADNIGKGYALAWVMDRIGTLEQGVTGDRDRDREAAAPVEPAFAVDDYDAVVIIDADTLVSPNLLREFAAKLAAGECAVQARYEVLNVGETWRTRLMSCALALAHIVKPLGRERLLLSDGLKGNGMCFARSVIEKVRWSGDSITEDIEYTIRLCQAGYRVSFAPAAAVWAQMPTTAGQSVSQRKRWEGGRYHLIFHVAPGLLTEALRKKSRILLDRAIELIIPPFAEMFAAPCLMLGVCVVMAAILHWQTFTYLSLAWGAVLFLQAAYLAGGMWIARIPLSVAMTAVYAPGYIVWKFGVYGAMLINRSAGGWKRTERREIDS